MANGNGDSTGGTPLGPWGELLVKVGVPNAIALYVVFWLTNTFAAKIDHLSSTIDSLRIAIERMPK